MFDKVLIILSGILGLLFYSNHAGISFMLTKSVVNHYLHLRRHMSVEEREIYNEAKLDVTLLINLYGYPAENHTVETSDGYILTMHRIPYSNFSKSENRTPIFLQHGFLSKSATWVSNMNNSIGFRLADEGFDVWMGNFRGNQYSNQHKFLKTSSKDYWNFGWDKLTKFDIPTMIDYIRNHTGHDKILTMGHSMGALTLFAATASQPEFHQKIKGIVAVGPAVHFRYFPSFLMSPKHLIAKNPKIIKSLFGKSFIPYKESEEFLLLRFQIIPFDVTKQSCDLLIGFLPLSPQEKLRFPLYLSTTIGGTSAHVYYHINEMTASTKVLGYNYGNTKNLREYNQAQPLEYNFTKVNVPVAIMHFANDALSSAINVALVVRKLPKLIASEMLHNPMATHMDYFFLHRDELIFKTILDWIQQMNKT